MRNPAMSPDPRITATDKERAFLDFLTKLWPGGAGYRLDSYEDRQTQEDAERLIEAGVVERIEESATVTDTGEVADAAVYRLTTDFVGGVGGTPRPQDN
jgi:hypothetical protein